MSTTAASATCDAFVAAIGEYSLLSPEGLEQAKAALNAYPEQGVDDFAAHLVEEGLLTRFQANVLLAGEGKKLTLSLFTLTDEIGAGCMGKVYRARLSKDDGWYAIKIVPRRNVINLQSIGEKVAALKQIRHPRVSAMVHIGAQGDRVYLVWPFLEGGLKLEAVIDRQGALAPRHAAQVALQIASGLQAYHEHDLFHGLLKPSDILIGSDRRVRILDFGVAFLLTCDRGKALLDTTTNTRALTRGLDCASPESIMDPLDRSAWGDQYSLGCILYFCLAGQYPFPTGNPVKKMMGHQFEEPTPIEQLVPETPAKLAAIVHRLLRKRPEERYPSTAEIVADLQTVTADSRIGTSVPMRESAAPAKTSIDALPPPMRPSARLRATPAPTLDPVEQLVDAEEAVYDPEFGSWLKGWWVVLAAGAAAGLLAWYATHS